MSYAGEFCPRWDDCNGPRHPHTWQRLLYQELDGVVVEQCAWCPTTRVTLQVGLVPFLDQLREHIGAERVASWHEGYRFGSFDQFARPAPVAILTVPAPLALPRWWRRAWDVILDLGRPKGNLFMGDDS